MSRIGMSHHSLRRAVAALVTLIVAGVFVTNAFAGYWDYSGNLVQYDGYAEGFIPPNDHIRLSRSACGTKIELYDGSSWNIQTIPGGCATSDYGMSFSTSNWAAMCYNVDGPTMWINCRVADAL